jgi:hypothetical protein
MFSPRAAEIESTLFLNSQNLGDNCTTLNVSSTTIWDQKINPFAVRAFIVALLANID